MNELNCLGMVCPMPVIETKKKLNEMGPGKLKILVDDMVPVENLKKLANSMDISYEVEQLEEGYAVIFDYQAAQENNQENDQVADTFQPSTADLQANQAGNHSPVLLIATEHLGKGEAELGNILMKGFLYTLSTMPEVPTHILLLNSGIKLATENEETIAHLQTMEKSGSQIMVCGTCLDYYNQKDQLAVGQVVNMYDIVETLSMYPNPWMIH